MLVIVLLVATPLLTALSTWLLPQNRIVKIVHLLGALILLINGIVLLYETVRAKTISHLYNYIYIDAFSALFILILVLIFFFTSMYTVGYLETEVKQGTLTHKQVPLFYLGFHLFMFTMIVVMILNNLTLVWIAIEFTTLVSALLIAFYRTKYALEAAWKYLIIGSLGIAFALFGILFLLAASKDVINQAYDAFNWTTLVQFAPRLDSTWTTIAFVFVLVGYGTKAGLAPMHFWLPDAHSEAPSPISAILSGVLLNTALYGLLRIYLIVHETLDGLANKWLLFFGLFSIGLMVPFILVQHNFKRMLAYSSVEHIGVITFSIGLASPLAIYGAMLHAVNHSIVKSMLFMATGNIHQRYKTKNIHRVRGLFKVMPLTAFVYFIGILAIAGTPPFNIFISEWTIMLAGFSAGHWLLTSCFILFILIIFAGMVVALVRMVFNEPQEHINQGESNRWTTYPLLFPLLLIGILAVWIPPILRKAIEQTIAIFT